jgi:hypothetical protein
VAIAKPLGTNASHLLRTVQERLKRLNADTILLLQPQLQPDYFGIIAVFFGYLVSLSSCGEAAEIIHFARTIKTLSREQCVNSEGGSISPPPSHFPHGRVAVRRR